MWILPESGFVCRKWRSDLTLRDCFWDEEETLPGDLQPQHPSQWPSVSSRGGKGASSYVWLLDLLWESGLLRGKWTLFIEGCGQGWWTAWSSREWVRSTSVQCRRLVMELARLMNFKRNYKLGPAPFSGGEAVPDLWTANYLYGQPSI